MQNHFLFKYFPSLKSQIHYIPLAQLPTPINKLKNLSTYFKTNLYIKLDSLAGNLDNHLYGGNKVRKLEFLLADALKKEADTILTFGAIGSNHVVATACYAQKLGLNCIGFLKKQPISTYVHRNLLLMHYFNCKTYLFSQSERNLIQKILIDPNFDFVKNEKLYVIPAGGSNTIGILGFVNAAFELKEQINNGIIPEPDYIYVAGGSFGTSIGLSLGLQILGLKTKIRAVCVEPIELEKVLLDAKLLFEQTNQLLHFYDSIFPIISFNAKKLKFITKMSENDYGLAIPEGAAAKNIFEIYEKINLDDTYTARAAAALINDLQSNTKLKNKTILFWHTFCDNFTLPIMPTYTQLPSDFHQFF
ncbi:MAG: pyridoxal-phosphate dependent enzyme [Candidatus Babeliales bacterium]